ncbi:o-succinylbenzoate--CoA ligase [Intrasporangium calvum]|uniref:AMP-dependent synthetase and ligase n=1 Tax=Intrasporangium calvum (strain ATCC 23552 / DSM 43043 / JCM 3097 / NBRC 12989 / NCIMB 10167 / NRRL B-3866 / 7 KIP) TaxID=710696 RepID=E6SAG7_INTC7|nr:o-succinylbenzoate--CoA ligase [Intrasporangium calvum]ADU47217.1 AMP-dependent synthetase and ligase [Intrasporangium calvum DSM 43043]
MTAPRLLPVPAGPDALTILPDLEAALTGRSPVIPYAAELAPPVIAPHDPAGLPDGFALAVGTSGSTGRPKRALLTAAAVTASATATHHVLGGSGSWLLALPAHHIAGLQVLTRSLTAGTTPTVLDLRGGFTAAAFARAAGSVTMSPGAPRRYTSLVPTQLGRLLDDPAGVEALQTFDAVLVGGAATPTALEERARKAGVALHLTFGMSETAGGCVYDGVPLPVTRMHIDNDRHIILGGDTVAHGYLGEPELTADAFSTDVEDVRWFRTDDLGHIEDDGRLVVDGRADDVIITGGMKVTPGVVEDAVARHVPEVAEVVVLGVPDPEWGETVCAAVTLLDPTAHLTAADLRSRLSGILPDAALPRRVVVLPTIPLRGPGKPDRAAIRLVAEAHA